MGPITLSSFALGCLSTHSSNTKVAYKFFKTFENPIFLISYGTKNAGKRISSGTHLYSSFPPVFLLDGVVSVTLCCLPYVLFPAKIITPGIADPERIEEWSI